MKGERRINDSYVTVSTVGEPVRAFVPAPLPRSRRCTGHPRFAGVSTTRCWRSGGWTRSRRSQCVHLLYSFVRKEAVLSSQIEGTQSSLADRLLYEIDEQPGVPVDDAREVSRHVAAQEAGLAGLRRGLPMCMRLFLQMH